MNSRSFAELFLRTLRLSMLIACVAVVLTSMKTAYAAEPAGSSLSAEQWRADLAYLAKELPLRHKNAFAHTSREDFERQVVDLDARIPRLTDAEIRAGLLKVVASLGDAHTDIWGWGIQNPFRELPIALRWFKDGVFVVGAAERYRSMLGGKVERVGRTGIDEASQKLAAYIAHDTDTWVIACLPWTIKQTDLLYAAGIAESPDRVTMQVQLASGERVSRTIEPSLGEKLVSVFNGTPPVSARTPDTPYWADVVGSTLYFQYNKCWNNPKKPFEQFVSELKGLMSRPDISRVVIDLRQNDGGNSEVLVPWFEEISASRFNRKGGFFVLVGRTTFSSGLLNAYFLREKTAAIVVGEPSGGSVNGYGEVRQLELPNSHIHVAYSTKYFQVAPDNTQSLLPDVLIEESFQDYTSGKDPVLNAVVR